MEICNKGLWENESSEGGVLARSGSRSRVLTPAALLYMTHLRLHPAVWPTLVFTRPPLLKRPSRNWPDSCDTSAKHRAC